ncbi:twin-arginine translocase TatA/TatE family subunit [Spirosoma oryzae]|nr:twin-arginine translocase TatA/TatE family subunit [Spirosoma oryzae]
MMVSSIFAVLGLGSQEMILIFLALLLLFGAKKIPELARGLGKGIREFKDATKDVRENIEDSLKETDTHSHSK